MNLEEQLQLVEDVCLSACFTLHQYRKGNMGCGEAIVQIKTELQKLECLTTTPEKPNHSAFFMLTNPIFAAAAYLQKNSDGGCVVIVDNNHVTGCYSSVKTALDEYVTQCESDDFIIDFLQGVDKGTCRYGDNKYAQYVKKCFDTYRIGREL